VANAEYRLRVSSLDRVGGFCGSAPSSPGVGWQCPQRLVAACRGWSSTVRHGLRTVDRPI